jgi:DNA end-binding protein Ku
VPAEQIDERFYDSPYYVVPNDAVGQDAFSVIRYAMRSKGTVAIGSVVYLQTRAANHSEARREGAARHDAAVSL